MATKKDLVEAHAFSRRRLVTAFVSGAPGGREVEPVRPGRVLIGGVALSVLLLAGAAIAGFLLGRPPAQWLESASFVISKDTGEQYVVLRGGDDPLLQRVPNYVSAQLLLGEAELTPFTVRDKYIRTVQLGEDLGIEGAPAGLPSADELVDDGWTACTGDGVGIKVAGLGGRRSRAAPELHHLRVVDQIELERHRLARVDLDRDLGLLVEHGEHRQSRLARVCGPRRALRGTGPRKRQQARGSQQDRERPSNAWHRSSFPDHPGIKGKASRTSYSARD